MDDLLPLPKEECLRVVFGYTADQMRAYAAACVAAERERCAKEAEHWQKISTTPGHSCGQYIAAAIRGK